MRPAGRMLAIPARHLLHFNIGRVTGSLKFLFVFCSLFKQYCATTLKKATLVLFEKTLHNLHYVPVPIDANRLLHLQQLPV